MRSAAPPACGSAPRPKRRAARRAAKHGTTQCDFVGLPTMPRKLRRASKPPDAAGAPNLVEAMGEGEWAFVPAGPRRAYRYSVEKKTVEIQYMCCTCSIRARGGQQLMGDW